MKNGLSFFAFLKQHLEAPNQTRPLQRKFATCNSGFKIFFHYTTKIARPVMARAPHQNLFRHFQPITYTPSSIRTKTPKISAVHVNTNTMLGHREPHPLLKSSPAAELVRLSSRRLRPWVVHTLCFLSLDGTTTWRPSSPRSSSPSRTLGFAVSAST
jgi:hypothetical protein